MNSISEQISNLIESTTKAISSLVGNINQKGGYYGEEEFYTVADYTISILIITLIFVFILMILYSLYLTFTCDTNIIVMFFNTILSIITPAIPIALSFYSGCTNEILWSSLTKSMSSTSTNIIVIIGTIIGTLIPIIIPLLEIIGLSLYFM